MTDQGKFLPSATAISYSGDQVKVTWEMSDKPILNFKRATITKLLGNSICFHTETG